MSTMTRILYGLSVTTLLLTACRSPQMVVEGRAVTHVAFSEPGVFEPALMDAVLGRKVAQASPVAQATIELYPVDAEGRITGGPVAEGRTEPDGSFYLGPVDLGSAGGFLLEVSKGGYLAARAALPRARDRALDRTCILVPEAEVRVKPMEDLLEPVPVAPVDDYLSRARGLAAGGDWNGVRAELQGRNPMPEVAQDFRVLLARALLETGDPAGAGKLLEEALRHAADDASLYVLLARAWSGQGQHAQAVSAWRRVLALDPDYPGARLGLGLALMDDARPQAALEPLRMAAAAEMPAGAAHTAWVRALLATGQRDQARVALESRLVAAPKDAAAHLMLGRLLVETGLHAEALAHLKSFVSLAGPAERDLVPTTLQEIAALEARTSTPPSVVAGPLDEGRRWLDAGYPGRALPLLEEAQRAEPTSPEAQWLYGRALRMAGRHDDAVRALAVAVRLIPGNADLLLEQGRTLLVAGRAVESVEPLQQAAAIRPAHAETLLELGYARLALGRGADADQAFREAGVVAGPAAPVALSAALTGQARVALAAGDATKALDLCEQARQQDPNALEADFYRAEALRGLDRLEEARDGFGRYVERARSRGLSGPLVTAALEGVQEVNGLLAGKPGVIPRELVYGPGPADRGPKPQVRTRAPEAAAPAAESLEQALARVRAQLESGRAEDARTAAQAVAQDHPQSEAAWVLVGDACMEGRDAPAAAVAYERARSIQSDSLGALYGLGMARVEMGRRADALAVLMRFRDLAANLVNERARLLRVEPLIESIAREVDQGAGGKAAGLYTQGRQAFDAGRYPQAQQAFRQAVDLRPAQAEYSLWLGKTFLVQDRKEQALAAWRGAVDLGAEDRELLLGYGRLALELGQGPAAVPALEKYSHLAYEDAEGHYLMGLAYRAVVQDQRAREEFRLARSLDMSHTRAQLEFCRVLLDLGDYRVAVEETERLVAAPDAPAEAWWLRGMALSRSDRSPEAAVALRRFLDAPDAPEALRARAADELGRLGVAGATPAVASSSGPTTPDPGTSSTAPPSTGPSSAASTASPPAVVPSATGAAQDDLSRALESLRMARKDATTPEDRARAAREAQDAAQALLDAPPEGTDPALLAQAMAVLGQALYTAGQTAEAEAAYAKALEADPANAAALVGRAWLAHDLGDWEATLAAAGKALEAAGGQGGAAQRTPVAADASLLSARALFNLFRWSEAAKAYQVTLDQDPANYEAAYNMGTCLESSGELRGAIDAFQQYLQLADGVPSEKEWIPGLKQKIKELERMLERENQ